MFQQLLEENNKLSLNKRLRTWEGFTGSVVDAAAGIASTYINNKMASQREEVARRENYEYNEKAADAADERQRAQWKDMYSIGAQAQQYKQAGLSLSAMYGGGAGQGGATAPQGGGAAGIEPNVYGFPGTHFAQAALIEAQARKTNAEADVIQGKNEMGIAEIEQKMSQSGYYKSATRLADTDTALREIEKYVKEETIDDQINSVAALAEKAKNDSQKAFYDAQLKKQEFEFNKEVWNERVKGVINQNAKLVAETLYTDALRSKTETEKEAIQNEIMQKWEQIYINWQHADIARASQEAQQKFWEQQIENMTEQLKQSQYGLELSERRLTQDVKESKNRIAQNWVKTVAYLLETGTNIAATIIGVTGKSAK